MKKIIILLFLTINSYAQIQSGKIEYKLVIGYDEKLSNDAILKPYLEKAQEGAKQISFFLSFNKEASFFKMNDFVKDEISSLARNSGLNGSKFSNFLKTYIFPRPRLSTVI